MDTVVLKFGGSSVADNIKLNVVAEKIKSFYDENKKVVVVVSAQGKTTDGLIDDFARMKEAVSRRYSRLLNEQSDLPDLILIDGGIGQVNAVEEILNSLGLDIPVAGLAERDEDANSRISRINALLAWMIQCGHCGNIDEIKALAQELIKEIIVD